MAETLVSPGCAPVRVATRLLLVEDDDLDVVAFHRALHARQLTVELQRARNAAEAFEMLRLQRQVGRGDDIVLVLDLNMPCLGGLEFLAQLRADAELADTVVFAFTTSAAPEDVRLAYRHHVAGYVVKAVLEDSTKALVDLLATWLGVVRLPVR